MSRRQVGLAGWRELLGQLGALGESLRAAIVGNDVAGAIAAMVELRRARIELFRVEPPATLVGNAAEAELLADVRDRLAAANVVEDMMARWLARAVPGDEQLLASPLGIAVFADQLLPAVWDFEADLVVLVGTGLEPVAQLLCDLGQRRVVIHGGAAPPATAAAPAPASAIVTTTRDELTATLRALTPVAPARFVVRCTADAERAELAELTEVVRTALGDLRIQRNTVQAFSRTWLEQGVANLPAIAAWPSIAALDDKLVGKPMVIVAPGPSLAGNAAALRELRGRAIVCAFSHSLKPVLAAGIVPDLVLTVDPQDVRYHFAECDVSQTCLVNAATVHPSLFELGAPRHLTLSANCAIDQWIFDGVGEEAAAPGGGSVATAAYSLALRWRCDPIIFVGLDLSFPGGRYYVETSTDGAARAVTDADGHVKVEGWSPAFHQMKAGGGPAAATERQVELPGWHGGTVPSSFMFSVFHRWFVEHTAALAKPAGAHVYNCTEGGCSIEGMAHRPLAEVIAELPELADQGNATVTAALQAAIAGVTDERHAKVAAHVASYARQLALVRRHARRAYQLARCADARLDGKLAATEQALTAALEPVEFVSLLAQRELERAQEFAYRPAEAAEYRATSATLFDTLVRVVDHLAPLLRTAAARLAAQRRAHEAA